MPRETSESRKLTNAELAREAGIEVTKLSVIPDMSNRNSTWRPREKSKPSDAVIELLKNERRFKETTHRINQFVDNMNPWNNPAQSTAEAIDAALARPMDEVMMSLDTEWIGGGKGIGLNNEIIELPTIITEFGASTFTKGSLVPTEGFTFAMAATSQKDVQVYRDIYNRCIDAWKRGENITMTPDEHRSMRDLIAYSKKMEMSADGVINKRVDVSGILDTDSLAKYWQEIDEGLKFLETGGRSSGKAVRINEVHERIAKTVMAGKGDLGMNPIFSGHNWTMADAKVWNRATGYQDIGEIVTGKKGVRAKVIDSLVVMRAAAGSLAPELAQGLDYEKTYSMENVSKILGLTKYTHMAGKDAQAQAAATLNILNRKVTDPKRTILNGRSPRIHRSKAFYKAGSEMFATSSVRKESPFDFVMEDGKVVDYSQYSVYRDRIYQLEKEVEYEFGDKKYFGAILKTSDGASKHYIFRETQDELRNTIQSNFMSMDMMSKAEIAKTRAYDRAEKAASAYNRMFAGDQANKYFQRTLNVMNTLDKHGWDFKKAKQELVRTGATKAQLRDMETLLPRLRSEHGFFQKVGRSIANLTEVGKNYALAEVFAQMNQISSHRALIEMPEHHRQAMLSVPGMKDWRIQTSSHAKMAQSISTVLRDNMGNPDYNFQDMRARARIVIEQMQRDATDRGKGMTKEELGVLRNRINNMKAPSNNSLSGVALLAGDIAQAFSGRIIGETAVEKEAVVARSAASVEAINKIDLLAIKDRASTQGGSGSRQSWSYGVTKELREKINEVDSYLDNYARSFVGEGSAVKKGESIEQSLQKMLGTAKHEGLGLEIRLNEKKTGLTIALMDMAHSSAVARGEIPLVETSGEWAGTFLDTGSVNIAMPRIVDGQIVIDSHQNKVLNKMNTVHFMHEVKKRLGEGDIAGAESYMSYYVRDTLGRLPGSSSYRYSDEMQNVTGRSLHQNYYASRQVDLNELMYSHFQSRIPSGTYPKSAQEVLDAAYGRNVITSNEFLHTTFLDSDKMFEAGIKGIKSDEAREDIYRLRNMIKKSGMKLSVANKGERAQAYIVTDARTGDARDAVSYGYFSTERNGKVGFSDMARENYLQRMNYNPIRDTDRVLDFNGNLTQRSALGRGDKAHEAMNRQMNRRYLQQQRFAEAADRVGGVQDSQNLVVAFMDPSEVHNWVDKDWVSKKMESGDFSVYEMPNTGIDQAILDKSVLPYMQVNDTAAIAMPSGFRREGGGRLTELTVGQYINEKMIREMEELTGQNLYKHGSTNWVFEGWEEPKGPDKTWRMKISKINEVSGGSKFISTGGNKFSTRIAQSIPEMMGKGFEDVQGVVNLSPNKMPGDMIESQFRWLAHAATISGKTAADQEKVQAQLNQIWEKATVGSTPGMRPTISFADGVWRVTIPNLGQDIVADDAPKFTMNFRDLARATDAILTTEYKSTGLRSIIERDGRTVFKGMMAVTQPNATHWESVSADGRVRMNARNLMMLRGRAQIYGRLGGISDADVPDFDTIFQSIVDAGDQEKMSIHRKEGHQLMDVLRAAGGADIAAPIHSDPYSILSGSSYEQSAAEIRGSILDPKLHNGEAHYMKLAAPVKVGDQTLDKILIPSLHLNREEDITLDSLKKSIYNLQQWNEEYKESFLFKGDDYLKDKMTPSQREDLLKKGTQLTHEYLTEVGNAFQSKDGYIWRNMTTVDVKHSGHARYQITQRMNNPQLDAFLKENLPEGDTLISRKDFGAMLGKAGDNLTDSDIKDLFTQAEKGEFYGLTLREPVTQDVSMRATKFRVLTKEAENDLFGRMGKDVLTGSMLHTVGTSVAQKADTDGDMAFFLAPWLANYQDAKRRNNVSSQIKKMFNEEKAFYERLEEDVFKGISSKVNSIWDQSGNDIVHAMEAGEGGDRVASRLMAEAVATQSRLTKQVGLFSNMSARASAMAKIAAQNQSETIGKYMTATTTALFAAVEQIPTSFKKIGEVMDRSLSENGTLTADDVTDAIRGHVSAMANMRTSFRTWDVKGMTSSMQQMGLFDKEGKYTGGAKAGIEGAVIPDGFSIDEAQKLLYTIRENNPELSMGDTSILGGPAINIGKSEFYGSAEHTAQKSIALIKAYDDANTMSPGFELLARQMGDDVEEKMGKARAYNEAMAKTSAYARNARSVAGDLEDAVVLPGGSAAPIDTVGTHVAEKMAKAIGIGENIGTGALGIAAGAVGLGIVASRFLRPNVEHEPEAGSAGSADEEARSLPPSAYAGAPMGSAPAYISEEGRGYAKTNIRISGRAMPGVDHGMLADELSREISRQSGLQMNIQISNTDDRETIDSDWLNQQFSNALKTGYVS